MWRYNHTIAHNAYGGNSYYASGYSDELYHHGVLGMKWGIRKERIAQNRANRKARRKKAINNIRNDWNRIPKNTRALMLASAGMVGTSLLARGISKGIKRGYGIKGSVQAGRATSELFRNGETARFSHLNDSSSKAIDKALKAGKVYRNIRSSTRGAIIAGSGVLGGSIILERNRRKRRQKGEKK